MDEYGFCNPPGLVSDIIVLGDSFAWCYEVKPTEIWVAQLHAYSLGTNGTGPQAYLQLLKRYGLSRKPKLVILNIYAGNDLFDAAAYEAYRTRWKDVEAPPCSLPPALCSMYRSLKDGFVGRRSYAFNTIVHTLRVMRDEYHTGSAEAPQPNLLYHIGDTASNIDNDGNLVRIASGDIPDFSLFDKPLDEFAELAKAHGFQALITYTPMEFSVYSEQIVFDDAKRTFSRGQILAFGEDQRNYLGSAAKERNIPFLDLTSALRTKSDLYFHRNLHWTPEGHRVVAEAVRRELRERSSLASAAGLGHEWFYGNIGESVR